MAQRQAPHLALLRSEVRAFVADRSPDGPRPPRVLRQWVAALHAAGHLGADWPAEHGGTRGRDPLADLAVAEEIARGGAPRPTSAGVARAIIQHGTDEQRARHLPRIRSGDDLWCRPPRRVTATRAAGLVVHGSAGWTRGGRDADRALVLASTQDGRDDLVAVVVDLASPGVTRRAAPGIGGPSDLAEIVLDGVPATETVGAPHQGRDVAVVAAEHERVDVGGDGIELLRAWRDLWVRAADPTSTARLDRARHDLVEVRAAIDALRHLVRAGLAPRTDDTPPVEAWARRLRDSVRLRLCDVALDVVAPTDPQHASWLDARLEAALLAEDAR